MAARLVLWRTREVWDGSGLLHRGLQPCFLRPSRLPGVLVSGLQNSLAAVSFPALPYALVFLFNCGKSTKDQIYHLNHLLDLQLHGSKYTYIVVHACLLVLRTDRSLLMSDSVSVVVS